MDYPDSVFYACHEILRKIGDTPFNYTRYDDLFPENKEILAAIKDITMPEEYKDNHYNLSYLALIFQDVYNKVIDIKYKRNEIDIEPQYRDRHYNIAFLYLHFLKKQDVRRHLQYILRETVILSSSRDVVINLLWCLRAGVMFIAESYGYKIDEETQNCLIGDYTGIASNGYIEIQTSTNKLNRKPTPKKYAELLIQDVINNYDNIVGVDKILEGMTYGSLYSLVSVQNIDMIPLAKVFYYGHLIHAIPKEWEYKIIKFMGPETKQKLLYPIELFDLPSVIAQIIIEYTHWMPLDSILKLNKKEDI
jgi:hypothetical protein